MTISDRNPEETKLPATSNKKLSEAFEQKVNNFSFFDSLSLRKREEFLETCLGYLEKTESTKGLGEEEIKKIRQLTNKGIEKAKGGAISNIFINLFYNNFGRFKSLIYKLDKLVKFEAPFAIIKSIKNASSKTILESTNVASQLLFNCHIYEKMLYFDHSLKEKDGAPLFKYTKKTSLKRSEEDQKAVYENKDITLEIKNPSENGLFERIAIKDLSQEAFDKLIKEHEHIEVIYPTQWLTVEELKDEGVITQGYYKGQIHLSKDYLYLDEGFVKRSQHNWTTLKPTNHTNSPPKDHQLEIIVHCPNQDIPGVLSDQGHASIKITTPGGEIYDVGFFPHPEFESEALEFEAGALLSPDPFTFYPKHFMNQTVMSYTLNPKAFEEVIKKIESIQNSQDNDDKTYHLILKNCSAFARDIRDTALEHGAQSNTLKARKFSYLEKVRINALESFAAFVALNFYTDSYEDSKKNDPKAHKFCHLKSEGIYLPVNLLFDRTLGS